MGNAIFRDLFQKVYQAQQLSSSPLIRSDEYLFTFSPIQDEVGSFTANESGIFMKEQACFRTTYPSNLVNPLAAPYQNLIGLFSFEPVRYVQIMQKFVDEILELQVSSEDIFVIAPDIEAVQKELQQLDVGLITIPKDRLYCNLPIEGTHYYVKFCIRYHEGLVTIMNYVLVDYHGKSLVKLDSVFFPRRMEMIQEGVASIYETRMWKSRYKRIFQETNSHSLTHFILSQSEALTELLSAVGDAGHKKQAYVVKKLARELFVEMDLADLSFELFIDVFPELSPFLHLMYQQYQLTVENALMRIRRSKKVISAEYALNTWGLPLKLFQKWIDPELELEQPKENFAYHRDWSRNQYANPLESYR